MQFLHCASIAEAPVQTPEWNDAAPLDPMFTGPENFYEWYHDIEGKNIRILKLANFVWKLDPFGSGEWAYVWDQSFAVGPYFPIDGEVSKFIPLPAYCYCSMGDRDSATGVGTAHIRTRPPCPSRWAASPPRTSACSIGPLSLCATAALARPFFQ